MRIGELARRTGATRRALRYYEEQGLLPDRRSPNGYREYDEHAVRLVDNIRRLLSVGFTAEEIVGFLPCMNTDTPLHDLCPAGAEAVARKLASVQSTIDDLTLTRDRLTDLLAAHRGPPPLSGCAPTYPVTTSVMAGEAVGRTG
ncbi:MerR family transcriptional regulator [Nocardia mexicana]|uniref:DNA-binding transcriptional MerR regulator n=1 Tax=Nocardia mexicana TaxID=279262 RepID=A0A370H204_9NOCA|nr:MerR family transcriptional regulator [Nocardia mexicana]RDI49057.1 DNA-binding transcriptional MerR regulator [Nocardia mexicana]